MKLSSTFSAISFHCTANRYPTGKTVDQSAQGVFHSGSPFRKDRCDFSPYRASSGVVDALNQQKMSIQDRKNELIASAEENGLSQESIQAQLDSYDEQIEKIDEQITEVSIQQMMTAAEQQTNVVKQSDHAPKTEQEIQNEKMQNLISLSSGLDRVSMTNATKTKVDGRSRVLETEIELDQARAGASSGSSEAIAAKEAERNALQLQSRSLNLGIGKQLTGLKEQIQENNKPVTPVEEPEADGTVAPPNASKDGATIPENKSSAASIQPSKEPHTHGLGTFQTMIAHYVQMAELPDTYTEATWQVDTFA